MPAYPPQTPDNIRNVRAEHSPVHVHLVNHDKRQSAEELGPVRMVRQYSQVEHVRIGEDRVAVPADLAPFRCASIPVVYAEPRAVLQAELPQLPQLILCQRLRGKQVERILAR